MKPNKPHSVLLKLDALGVIHGLEIEQKQNDTFCKIIGERGKCEGLWRTYSDFLDVGVGWNSIAQIKNKDKVLLVNWREFQTQYAVDIQEFKRLAEKLGFDHGA
ncbi:MAG: hypothetical protein COA47_10305 [Robiginitomaculum sp.]|nr:MAG: hypothetical protein COA47_10305 [Robiginitomaculum sp.]